MDRPPNSFFTSRLLLRRPREADAAAVFSYAADPQVTYFMDWRRLAEVSEASRFIHDSQTTWESGEEFTWVVTLQGVDEVIGGASYRARASSADFGYVLTRRFWGQGFASEMALALVNVMFANADISRIWATCDAENSASRRVLEKAGLLYEGLLPSGVVRPNIGPVPRDACLFGKSRTN